MHCDDQEVASATTRLQEAFGAPPPIAVVLGSGLGAFTDQIPEPTTASFAELGLPEPTVPGHAGSVRVGTLGDQRLAVVAGRVHLYEGLPPVVSVRGIRALHRWGVGKLLLTSAVGGLAEGFDPGTLVVIRDHLNLMGTSPLVGSAWGAQRFPDLSQAYHPELRGSLLDAAARAGVPVREGVYAAMLGPAYETPAEARMLLGLGADVAGMSVVPEVLAAAALGLPCAALSLVTNRVAGLGGASLTHAEVTEAAAAAAPHLAAVLAGAVASG